VQTFRRVDSLAALAVFILFCMPWLGINDGETVEMIWGLNVPDVAVTFGEVAELGRPILDAYFLVIIPILVVLFLVQRVRGKEAHKLGVATALVPLGFFLLLWLRVGQDYFSVLEWGFWLMQLAAVVMLFSLVGSLTIARTIDTVAITVGKVMFWTSLIMVLLGVYNVITRYLGTFMGVQLSSNTYLELQTYAYNLIFLLGAPYVLLKNSHVRIDLISDRLSHHQRAAMDIFGAFFLLVPLCLMGIYFSQSYVATSFRQLETSPNPGGLLRYPIKFIIIVAFVLLILQALSETIKNIAYLRGVENSGSIHDLSEDDHHEPNVTDQMEAI
jgi:TRAP-type mannitol/chloroaromatic compound transport system permease small subunit